MSMICKNCNSRSIKTRRNYPHGKKSSAVVSKICKSCGSNNIKEENQRYRKKRN